MTRHNNHEGHRMNVRKDSVESIAVRFRQELRYRGTHFLAVLPDGGIVWGPNRKGSLMARILSGEQSGEVVGGYTREATLEDITTDLREAYSPMKVAA